MLVGDFYVFNKINVLNFDVCSKANSGDSLSDMDVEMASMIVLEQVTIVIRTLPSGYLLPDAILASSHTINEVQIG